MLFKKIITVGISAASLLFSAITIAVTYEIPANSNIIGATTTTTVAKKDTLFSIAHQFDMGMFEMLEANANIKAKKLTPGMQLIIPSEYILPSGPREGIVLNLAELRLYFYLPNSNLVATYPVGIGKIGWKTPIGSTKITNKRERPTWHPPESIRAAYEAKGITLPEFIPPGPKNPLGNYAINLAWDGYLIHGTNQPASVGLRSSSGCIRMYAKDIAELFAQIAKDTPVRFVHEPFKIGSKNQKIYLEAHKPLSEPYYDDGEDDLVTIKKEIENIINTRPATIDWGSTTKEMQHPFGYPMPIGISQ